jgi:DNA modification methylase
MKENKLFYGDNLEIMRKYIADETVDLCYIDPPFNSKRNYNQIYNNIGGEDAAQARAFVDTWTWDSAAESGFDEIRANERKSYSLQTMYLINGLEKVLGRGSLFAYIVCMTQRIVEIRRVLKPTGNFYLHCDPTASHYLKIILDSVFCLSGGEFQNEIIWKRSSAHSDTKQGMRRYGKIHDVLFWYTKSDSYVWNNIFSPYSEEYVASDYKRQDEYGRGYKAGDLTAAKAGGDTLYEWRIKRPASGAPEWEADMDDEYKNPRDGWVYSSAKPYSGRIWAYSKENMREFAAAGKLVYGRTGMPRLKLYADEMPGVPLQDEWNDIPPTSRKEYLGYPTQKPIALLERIISVSSDEGGVVLDAFCGCGTTVAAAQKLKRKWIGIDITYQSVSLIMKRLEDTYGADALKGVELTGVPVDHASAAALANKADDKTRKEFEKWAILTYSNNRAMINEKKGSDKGIDGRAFILEPDGESNEILFSVKSGKVNSGMIRDFKGVLEREKAAAGIFITLNAPTKDMIKEAVAAGKYQNGLMASPIEKIQIVTADEILSGARLYIPLSVAYKQEVVKSARKNITGPKNKILIAE